MSRVSINTTVTEEEQRQSGAAIFRRIDEHQPHVGIDSQRETVYYSASSSRTETLPVEEYVNGVTGEEKSLVRPDVLTRVDSQLYRVRTITAESREVRRPRLML